jgi:malate synthase
MLQLPKISRTQVWQWLKNQVNLRRWETSSTWNYTELLEDEVSKISTEFGKKHRKSKFKLAISLRTSDF